jgi:hypothetical protein
MQAWWAAGVADATAIAGEHLDERPAPEKRSGWSDEGASGPGDACTIWMASSRDASTWNALRKPMIVNIRSQQAVSPGPCHVNTLPGSTRSILRHVHIAGVTSEAMPRVQASFRSKALPQRSGEANSPEGGFFWERTCR